MTLTGQLTLWQVIQKIIDDKTERWHPLQTIENDSNTRHLSLIALNPLQTRYYSCNSDGR